MPLQDSQTNVRLASNARHMRAWRLENREEANRRDREWYANNKEKAVLRRAVYRAKNKARSIWTQIRARCGKSKNYEKAKLCIAWGTFDNFKSWYDERLSEYPEGMRLDVDKDIIKPGNKRYSPELCLLVPHWINTHFKSASLSVFDYKGVYGSRCGGRLMFYGSIRVLGARHSGKLRRTQLEAARDYLTLRNEHVRAAMRLKVQAGLLPEHVERAVSSRLGYAVARGPTKYKKSHTS